MEDTNQTFIKAVESEKDLSIETAERFIEKGADVNSKDGSLSTPLQYACRNGNLNLATLLIKYGAHVNDINEHGMTPLLFASSRRDNTDMVQLLISNGAEVDSKDEYGWTSLHYACKLGYVHVAELLIRNGADVNRKANGGWTPLHIACINNRINMAMILLHNRADPNIKNDIDQKNASQLAELNGHNDLSEAILGFQTLNPPSTLRGISYGTKDNVPTNRKNNKATLEFQRPNPPSTLRRILYGTKDNKATLEFQTPNPPSTLRGISYGTKDNVPTNPENNYIVSSFIDDGKLGGNTSKRRKYKKSRKGGRKFKQRRRTNKRNTRY
jgi:ankyrin repeat protein